MKKNNFLSSVIIIFILALFCQPIHAGFFGGLAKMFGAKENSAVMNIANTVDRIGNSAIARKVDKTINKYAPEQAASYRKWAEEHNKKQEEKLNAFDAEKDQYMRDYCMQYGFYDLWKSQYGDQWFEKAGRRWFESRNDWQKSRGQEDLLPGHLRGNAAEETRYSPVTTSISNVVLNSVGLSTADAELANRWHESDKYEKQGMIANEITNIVAQNSSNPELVNALNRLYNANTQFLHNKAQKDPDAITNRNIDMMNIIFDAAETAKDRKRAFLQEKEAICEQLVRNGVSSDISMDLAGTVLAIQKNKSMTNEQKVEWLRQLGFYGHEAEVLDIAQQINNGNIPGVPEYVPLPEKENEVAKVVAITQDELLPQSVSVSDYAFDVVTLTSSQKEKLDEVAEVLNSNDKLNANIVGHTCSIGTNKVNDAKGLQRARLAKDYLVEKGVSSDRVTIESMGESSPLVPNDSKENRQKNRRIEVVFNK